MSLANPFLLEKIFVTIVCSEVLRKEYKLKTKLFMIVIENETYYVVYEPLKKELGIFKMISPSLFDELGRIQNVEPDNETWEAEKFLKLFLEKKI